LRRTILPLPVALKRFAAALRVLSFGMDWCYLDTSFYRITFVVLSAREICGDTSGWSIGQLLAVLMGALDTWQRMLDPSCGIINGYRQGYLQG
jgi:ABC-type nitrate/sulfonate/bicarbonate transport system permease component